MTAQESRATEYLIPLSESNPIRTAFMPAPPASATDTPATADPRLRQAWDSYHSALDEMRGLLENSSMFRNPRYRAKAFHIMMEIQAIAFNMAVAPRLVTPRIHTTTGWRDDMYSMGLVGPDWHYGLMYLDGAHTYRLTGRRGDNPLLIIQVVNRPLGAPDGKTTGNYDLDDMQVAPDGSYEIILGGPTQEGNWIPLDETSDCNFVFIRTQLIKYGNEDIGTYRIDHITPPDRDYYEREEFDEETMARRIQRAEWTLRIYIKEFSIGIHDFAMAGCAGQVNTMSLAPGLVYQGASPFSRYAQGVYSISDDEALVVELDRAPDAPYWGIMLGDVWSRCLPYSRYQTSLNDAQAVQDADGGYRFVVSIHDPGVANWLDPTGHNDGEIFFRNYLTPDAVVPQVHKVPFNEIMNHLPAETVTVTPAQREESIRFRRDGFLKLYGE